MRALALSLILGLLSAGPANAAVPLQSALKIVVVEGEDAVNIIQQKTAVTPVVEVRDENDLPVAGALVRFSIGGGKRATFAGGAQSLTVTTNAAGRAAAMGLNPTATGSVQIHVHAAFQGRTAAAVITQSNVLTAAQAAQTAASGSTAGSGSAAGAGGVGSSGGLSMAAIAGIAAGAAVAAGVTVAAQQGDQQPAPATSVAGTYSGSFALTGTATFDGGCVIDELYNVTNAQITIGQDLRGTAVVPVAFQFTSRTPAACGSDASTTTYTFPLTVTGTTFSSRLEFPLVIEPSGRATGGFSTVLSGEFQGDSVSGTMVFERAGGRGGTGTVRGNYSFPKSR